MTERTELVMVVVLVLVLVRVVVNWEAMVRVVNSVVHVVSYRMNVKGTVGLE